MPLACLTTGPPRIVVMVRITYRSKGIAISNLRLRRGDRIARRCSGGMGRSHGDRGKIEVAITTLSFDALIGVGLDEVGVSLSLDGHDGGVQVDQEELGIRLGIQRIGRARLEEERRFEGGGGWPRSRLTGCVVTELSLAFTELI